MYYFLNMQNYTKHVLVSLEMILKIVKTKSVFLV